MVVVVEMIAITSRRCTRFQPLTAAYGINNRTQVATGDRSLSLSLCKFTSASATKTSHHHPSPSSHGMHSRYLKRERLDENLPGLVPRDNKSRAVVTKISRSDGPGGDGQALIDAIDVLPCAMARIKRS